LKHTTYILLFGLFLQSCGVDGSMVDKYQDERLDKVTETRSPTQETAVPSTSTEAADIQQFIMFSLRELGNGLSQLGKYVEALEYSQQAIDMQKRIYGSQDHPEIARSLNNIGSHLSHLGKHKDALTYSQEALDMQKRLFSDQDHLDIATSLDSVGQRLSDLNQHDEALHYKKQALNMRRRIQGYQDNIDLMHSLTSVGIALDALGELQEGLQYQEEALAMYKRLFGDRDDVGLAHILHHIGESLIKTDSPKKGIEYCQEALYMRKRLYANQDHPQTAYSLCCIGLGFNKLERPTEGLNYAKDALNMLERLYPGHTHPHIQVCLSTLQEALDIYQKRFKQDESVDEILGSKPLLERATGDLLAQDESVLKQPLLPMNSKFFAVFVDFADEISNEATVEELKQLDLAEAFELEDNTVLKEQLTRTYLWNGQEYTPLHYVSEEGKLNLLKLLVEEYNLPPHLKTQHSGVIPLQCASVRGHYEVVEYLVEGISEACNVNYKDKTNDEESVLSYAMQSKNMAVIRYLFDKGAEYTHLDRHGNNVLHLAVQNGSSYFLDQFVIWLKAYIQDSGFKRLLTAKNKANPSCTPLELAQLSRDLLRVLECAGSSHID
ncbi:MAG: tetratricopeptide repeat protein, partial [Bacteroidota bacterium]